MPSPTASVPKFTFIVGNSYGAGNYAMCGKAYDPRLIFAWPTAQMAVMGGRQASETLLGIRLQQMQKGGREILAEEQQALLAEIQSRYDLETEPLYAAARLWVDGIVDPIATRARSFRPALRWRRATRRSGRFNPGVIQT